MIASFRFNSHLFQIRKLNCYFYHFFVSFYWIYMEFIKFINCQKLLDHTGRYAPNYIPSHRMDTPPKSQGVTYATQGSLWSPVQSGHFNNSQMASSSLLAPANTYSQLTMLPSGGLLQNYPSATSTSQVNLLVKSQIYNSLKRHALLVHLNLT